MQETVRQRFERVKSEHRDISGHLDILYQYALECESIVELGVNEGISTTAFVLANLKSFYCYDYIEPQMMLQELLDMCEIENKTINFSLADSRKIEIPKCDLLFIDTLHVYEQLIEELTLHADKVRKYILIHDTETFKTKGVVLNTEGLWKAIEEFLIINPQWVIKEHLPHCNGLTVLERKIKVDKIKKKYLLATNAFVNPDLLKICIRSWPNREDTRKFIFYDGENWRLIFENAEEIVLKYTDAQRSLNKHIGVSGTWNQIMKYAFEENDFETIIIVGSDTEMTEDFFEELVSEFEKAKADFSCCMGFNCILIRRKCYETVGTFDENFFPAYFEDNDYDKRVRRMKDTIIYHNVGNETKLKHYGSAVIRLNDKYNTANGITFSMNREYYNKKWGGNPTEEKFETPYNDSSMTLKDWIFDKEMYDKKVEIWNRR